MRDAGGCGRLRTAACIKGLHGIPLGVFGLEFSVRYDAYISIVEANDRRT